MEGLDASLYSLAKVAHSTSLPIKMATASASGHPTSQHEPLGLGVGFCDPMMSRLVCRSLHCTETSLLNPMG